MIFQWYADDFKRGGSVEAVLARYRPQTKADFALKIFKIQYKTYNWGLRFLCDYYWNK